jgi:hypothetical protein
MDLVFGTWARVIAAVVLVGLLGALGVGVYQAGFVAGAATEGATVVAPYAYGWGWGIGHGFFGFFGTLLVIFIIFGLLRAIFWRGPRWGGGWGYGHHGYGRPDGFRGSPWEDRAREVHDEWHRRQGGETSSGTTGSAGGSSGPGGSAG